MTVETQQTQAIYNSSDVAENLEIQESTLRKYCLILEKSGYEFLKNEFGHRAFFDGDLIVLRKFMELKSTTDMTLEQASKAVVAWKNGTDITEHDTEESRYVARYNDLMEEFKSFRESQESFNKELLNQLKRQQEYIDGRLEERDRNLMLAIRETLEVKKQLALAEPEQKKKWWEFWK